MKAHPVLLSVVIPAYNAADTIIDCLASVQGQYDLSYEVIVADDGSEDRTVELIGEAHFANTRVLRCPHRGVSAARNAGLTEARGRWIFFADADDIVSIEEILKMAAEASGDEDFVMFPYVEVSTDGREKLSVPPLPEGNYSERVVFEDLADMLLDSSFAKRSVTHFMMGRVYQYLFSSRFLEEDHLRFREDLHFAEDCLFLYRCFLTAANMSVKENVGYRRLYREGSVTHSYRPCHWEEYKTLLAGLVEARGNKPERAPQLMYAGGNYVMKQAVFHFGTENKKEGLEIVRKVLADPIFAEALRDLHFDDWTVKERIRNLAARKQYVRLYWRCIWMLKKR